MMTKRDEAVERLEKLLDVSLKALREDGDEEAALLALQEALKTATGLPKG